MNENEDLKTKVARAVEALCHARGSMNVIHPELGAVVINGKPTHALIAFFKKLERKRAKSSKVVANPGDDDDERVPE